jgi:hypothetical protein
VTQDTSFPIQVTGNLISNNFPFSGTDSILVKKTQSKTIVDYRLVGKNDTAQILRVEGLDLAAYVPHHSNLNEFFVSIGDPKIYGFNGFYSSGSLVYPYTINVLGIKIQLYKRIPYQIAAFFNRYDDCSVLEGPKIHCEGSGVLILTNQATGGYTRKVMETMRFDVENGKGSIEGGHVWNDMLSVKDLTLTSIRIS